MTRNGTQSPALGLNLASMGFDESSTPNRSEEDHAASIAYATRTPRNGRARVSPTTSCLWHEYENRNNKLLESNLEPVCSHLKPICPTSEMCQEKKYIESSEYASAHASQDQANMTLIRTDMGAQYSARNS